MHRKLARTQAPTQAGAVSEGMCSGARRLSPSASWMEGSERVEGLGRATWTGGEVGPREPGRPWGGGCSYAPRGSGSPGRSGREEAG